MHTVTMAVDAALVSPLRMNTGDIIRIPADAGVHDNELVMRVHDTWFLLRNPCINWSIEFMASNPDFLHGTTLLEGTQIKLIYRS